MYWKQQKIYTSAAALTLQSGQGQQHWSKLVKLNRFCYQPKFETSQFKAVVCKTYPPMSGYFAKPENSSVISLECMPKCIMSMFLVTHICQATLCLSLKNSVCRQNLQRKCTFPHDFSYVSVTLNERSGPTKPASTGKGKPCSKINHRN